MDIGSKKYPAKLLLFGEHTVLQGSASLAIPYPKYWMRWIEKTDEHPIWMGEYMTYLSEHCHDFLDINLLQGHSEKWTIEANIPIGYGLGSSGALTAAIYDVSSPNKVDDLITLQSHLGKMESFFHGESSGLDPLVSYTNVPLLKTKRAITTLNSTNLKLPCHTYLLDSGAPRSGKDMIERFVHNALAKKEKVKALSDLNDSAISVVLGKSSEDLLSIVRDISQVQRSLMPYMITSDLLAHWEEGLNTGTHYLKVCGAGGGGYYFLFSNLKLEEVGKYKLEEIIIE